MKYCKYCGNQIDDDSVFCSGCGKALSTTQSKVKRTTEIRSDSNVVIVPGSCPNCGSTSYQTTQTQDFQIKRPRVCNNCGSSYRTVEDIEKDIEYCKNAITPIIICGVVCLIMFFALSSAFGIWDVLSEWERANDDEKTLTIGFIIITIVVGSSIVPGLLKRGREVDELTEEKDHLEAKNRALDIKNASTIPDYNLLYKRKNDDAVDDSAMASVKYISSVPTENDFERLIEGSGLREFIIENGETDITYKAFRLNIYDRFKEMTEAYEKKSNSRHFICRKDRIELDIKLSYGDGVFSCEMKFKCQ